MAIEPLAIGVCSWSLQVKSVPEASKSSRRVGACNVIGSPPNAPLGAFL